MLGTGNTAPGQLGWSAICRHCLSAILGHFSGVFQSDLGARVNLVVPELNLDSRFIGRDCVARCLCFCQGVRLAADRQTGKHIVAALRPLVSQHGIECRQVILNTCSIVDGERVFHRDCGVIARYGVRNVNDGFRDIANIGLGNRGCQFA